ncbi:MAG TPA: type II toxin-antitoxin system HipA family toxin YjjJ [Deltaproteobacteria bacterium]|nr:type II toxin-antitoxin system HipA family toxin YjjJ [Deltaproteobacteria bacterium]
MRTKNLSNPEQLLSFLGTGIYSVTEIRQRFNCSQPTVSRLMTQLGNRVVPIGNARARRYTKIRDIRGLGGEFPLFKIDTAGNAHLIGTLYAIAQDSFLWKPRHDNEQIFRSLPWFIADLHPEGFAGRAFVRRLHQELGLPPRNLDWNEDHVLTALALRGEDTMGNLVIGQESIERYFRMVRDQSDPIPENEICAAYPRLAQEAMSGQPAGSSAGGEQPKFTTIIERPGIAQNVLVKFSPPVSTAEGRRWGDLLICEHLAAEHIQGTGISASRTNIIEAGDRIFLEVARFDRSGLAGRLPIISLRAVDNEFYGFQDNWINAANRMASDGRLSAQDAAALRWLSVFGSLIGNNDQHFGNISLIMVDGSKLFKLAPSYDMLPMFYRPVDGVAPSQPIIAPAAAPGAPAEWHTALESACSFWAQASSDSRISEEFRNICAENHNIVSRLRTGPRLFA